MHTLPNQMSKSGQSTNGLWGVRGTAASPSTAEYPVDESQRGLVP
jgi:hypothetical protein